jgi:hypothetical protein
MHFSFVNSSWKTENNTDLQMLNLDEDSIISKYDQCDKKLQKELLFLRGKHIFKQ